MADDELVGGISVELGAGLSKLEADLAAAERLVQAAVKEMSAQANITLGAQVRGGATGGGGRAAPAIDTNALAAAISQGIAGAIGPGGLRGGGGGRSQGTSVSFGAFGKVKGGSLEDLPADLQKQIMGALGETEQQAVEAARSTVQRVQRVAEQAPAAVAVAIDTEGLTAQLAEMTAELKAWREQAQEVLTVTPKVKGGGGRRDSREVDLSIQMLPKSATSREELEIGREQRLAQLRGQRAFTQSERHRRQELDATASFFDKVEALTTRHFDSDANRLGKTDARRSAAAYLDANPPDSAAGVTSSTFATIGLTPENRARGAVSPAADSAYRQRQRQRVEEARRQVEFQRRQANLAPLRETFASAEQQAFRGGSFDAEQQARRVEQRIQQQRVGITASGQTGRTGASGVAALFFGSRGEGIRARSEQAAAERALTDAQRSALPFRRAIAEADEVIANTSDVAAKAERQRERDAFAASDGVTDAFKREEDAYKRLETADKRLARLEGISSIGRNLTAVALGSFAFTAAMKAADVAVSALTPAVGAWIDQQTGFASTSTRVTSALAQQTAAQHGNVDAVLAQQAATAGLSQTTAGYISNQLRLTTQIKAGAIAQQNASDLFRASAGAGGQQGLFGGFGGIGGSAFLAQQLGGGKGFSESAFGDLLALNQPKGGQDFLSNINAGLSYLGSAEFRQGIDALGKQTGNKTPTEEVFPFFSAVAGGIGDAIFRGGKPPTQQTVEEQTAASQRPEVEAYLKNLNDAVERGGGRGQFVFTNDLAQRQAGATAAAGAGDLAGAAAAAQGFIVAIDGAAAGSREYAAAVQAAAVGVSKPTFSSLLQQNAAARDALIRNAERTQAHTLNTQLPAQQALGNLASPPPAIGTGIVSANADEQERITAGQQRSVELQAQLNTGYEQGKQILIDTYKIPPALISSIQSVGQEIANTQAGIRNDQAAYQVAQYNFQLHIARRSLADIGGLTGKNFGAGQSYLGVLERQNLQLSRQGQLLQFALAQRQINFQTAVAGFQAPGVTPEERQANVKQAQIEADFAQRALNIQREMFGNQVQIVDINNLRQGADLAAQIGLLLQGRQVTIDTAVAEEKLIRLNLLQQQQVAEAGTYLTKVDNLAAAAFSEIQTLEAEVAQAMGSAAQQVLDAYGDVLRGLYAQLPGRSNTGRGGTQYPSIPGGGVGYASGGVGLTAGTTTMNGVGYMGEAGTEAWAILRNPKAILSGGGGGSVVNNFDFSGMTVRSDNDINEIVRLVTKEQGRQASAMGMRQIG